MRIPKQSAGVERTAHARRGSRGETQATAIREERKRAPLPVQIAPSTILKTNQMLYEGCMKVCRLEHSWAVCNEECRLSGLNLRTDQYGFLVKETVEGWG